ncbi:MAG: hypothetical protein AAF567_14340 [Actinomycetota bacterium]
MTDDNDQSMPGVWRGLSLILVAASAIVIVIWIFQSRSASSTAALNARALDTDSTRVVVENQELPANAGVAVLGMDGRTRTTIGPRGVDLDVPSRHHSVIALFDGEGAIHGLAFVPPGDDRSPIAISPDSTARTVLSMAPSLLGRDVLQTRQDVAVISEDAAFAELTDALSNDTNISRANRGVEAALARILNRVPIRPLPDQGCDSVLNARAVPMVGTCVEPDADGVTISNEQDRWVVLFAGPMPWSQVCSAVAPTGTPGSQRAVSRLDCSDEALLSAPGPVSSAVGNEAAVANRVHIAAGVEVWSDYAAPLLDLSGGSTGLNRTDNSHVFDAIDELVATISGLIGQQPGFESAMQVFVDRVTPAERHAATLAGARSLAESAGTYVDGWNPAASTHTDILDFYDRVGEQMEIEDRLAFRWDVDGAGTVSIGEPS